MQPRGRQLEFQRHINFSKDQQEPALIKGPFRENTFWDSHTNVLLDLAGRTTTTTKKLKAQRQRHGHCDPPRTRRHGDRCDVARAAGEKTHKAVKPAGLRGSGDNLSVSLLLQCEELVKKKKKEANQQTSTTGLAPAAGSDNSQGCDSQ